MMPSKPHSLSHHTMGDNSNEPPANLKRNVHETCNAQENGTAMFQKIIDN